MTVYDSDRFAEATIHGRQRDGSQGTRQRCTSVHRTLFESVFGPPTVVKEELRAWDCTLPETSHRLSKRRSATRSIKRKHIKQRGSAYGQ